MAGKKSSSSSSRARTSNARTAEPGDAPPPSQAGTGPANASDESKLLLPTNEARTESYASDEATARAYAEQEGIEFDVNGKKGNEPTVIRNGTAFVIRHKTK